MEEARLVHSALGHQEMEVGVGIDLGSERLNGRDDSGHKLALRDGFEIPGQQSESRAAELAQQLPVIKTFVIPPGARSESRIRWTPDGQALTYSLTEGGASNIWIQPLAGGPARQLTNFTSDYINDFDWTPDNRLILARGPTNQDIVLISGREPR
jgi:hypothetical protein